MTNEEIDALVERLKTAGHSGKYDWVKVLSARDLLEAAQLIKELQSQIDAMADDNLKLVHDALEANVKASNAIDRAEGAEAERDEWKNRYEAATRNLRHD